MLQHMQTCNSIEALQLYVCQVISIESLVALKVSGATEVSSLPCAVGGGGSPLLPPGGPPRHAWHRGSLPTIRRQHTSEAAHYALVISEKAVTGVRGGEREIDRPRGSAPWRRTALVLWYVVWCHLNPSLQLGGWQC